MVNQLAVISSIYLYPVKSLRPIVLDKVIATKNGIAHPNNPDVIDRKWMVVNDNNSSISQRRYPRMSLIQPSLEGDFIVLTAPDMDCVKFPIKISHDIKKKCKLEEEFLDCYSYGANSDVSKWLSKFLEVDNLELVYFGNELEQRFKDGDYNSFMLISEASLSDLNQKLSKQVSIVNFRPNFLVKNCPAFTEDNWTQIQIDQSTFVKTKHCIRCNMTTVDPNTGVKDPEQQPLKTLREYRLNKELYNSPMFGVYFKLLSNESTVTIGDSVISIE